MIQDNTYRIWETAQRLTCHYDVLSQIMSLKQTTKKNIILPFLCTGYNFTWRPITIYIRRRYNFP